MNIRMRGVVSAVSRFNGWVAIRDLHNEFTVVAPLEGWTPNVGDVVFGDLHGIGIQALRLADDGAVPVRVLTCDLSCDAARVSKLLGHPAGVDQADLHAMSEPWLPRTSGHVDGR